MSIVPARTILIKTVSIYVISGGIWFLTLWEINIPLNYRALRIMRAPFWVGRVSARRIIIPFYLALYITIKIFKYCILP